MNCADGSMFPNGPLYIVHVQSESCIKDFLDVFGNQNNPLVLLVLIIHLIMPSHNQFRCSSDVFTLETKKKEMDKWEPRWLMREQKAFLHNKPEYLARYCASQVNSLTWRHSATVSSQKILDQRGEKLKCLRLFRCNHKKTKMPSPVTVFRILINLCQVWDFIEFFQKKICKK